MIDLDRIEQVAKAARSQRPGEWWVHMPDRGIGSMDPVSFIEWPIASDARTLELAEHIATCSPDVVLALVAVVKLSVEYEQADAGETSDVCDAAYLKWRAAVRALQGRK